MKRIQVFDLDGTLSNLGHRLKYVSGQNKDWGKFFSECYKDTTFRWVIDICNKFEDVLILSGRSDEVREVTKCWLHCHGVNYKWLEMRKSGDHTPDHKLKLTMLHNFIKNKYEVDFIVDDRQSVVDMWRANGYNVLQCNAWEEE